MACDNAGVALEEKFRLIERDEERTVKVPKRDAFLVYMMHQRKVEWLFDGEPFGRDELPKQLQTSLKSQLGLADITQHEPTFFKYLNKKQGSDIDDEANENNSLVSNLDSLVEDAINVLKEEIHSDDPNRRLQAAIAIMEFYSSR